MKTLTSIITFLTALISCIVVILKIIKKKKQEEKNEAEKLLILIFNDLHLWLLNHGIILSKKEVFALQPIIKSYPQKREIEMTLDKRAKNNLNIARSLGLLFLLGSGVFFAGVNFTYPQIDFKSAIIVAMLTLYLFAFGYYLLNKSLHYMTVLRIKKELNLEIINLDKV